VVVVDDMSVPDDVVFEQPKVAERSNTIHAEVLDGISEDTHMGRWWINIDSVGYTLETIAKQLHSFPAANSNSITSVSSPFGGSPCSGVSEIDFAILYDRPIRKDIHGNRATRWLYKQMREFPWATLSDVNTADRGHLAGVRGAHFDCHVCLWKRPAIDVADLDTATRN
jgi:hypothetical protein